MTETPEKPRPLTLPWFKPLWRRVVLIAIIAGWAGFEWFYSRDQWWQWITLAALAYGLWVFIINFDNELAKDTAKNNDAKPKN